MTAPPPLKVLMASTSYPSHDGDWRGTFIRNLTFALARRQGLTLLTWCPPGPMPPNIRYVATSAEQQWLNALSRSGGIAQAIKRLRPSGLFAAAGLMQRLHALYRREGDVGLVHANWLQVALPLGHPGRPLVATVLGTDYKLLSVPGMTTALRRVFRQRPTALCPNASWMVPGLERRFGDVATVKCVPFGIDDAYFAIERRPSAPAKWICVSRLTRAKIGDLFEWGESCFSGTQRELHLFGPMQEPMPIPPWVHYHGPASQAQLIGTWFPESTGLISLSRHPEGRPQVMLEAMAAGLPIVASDLDAHLDLLESSGAGLICRERSDLDAALAEVESANGLSIGLRGREAAREQYGSWDDCAGRYARIYRELVDQ